MKRFKFTRITRVFAALLIAGASLGPAAAQSGASLNGKWTAAWAMKGGQAREAWLEIQGDSGGWRTKHSNSHLAANRDRCLDFEAPATLTNVEAEKFELTVDYTKNMQGCSKFTREFRRIDDKKFESINQDGHKMTLIRH